MWRPVKGIAPHACLEGSGASPGLRPAARDAGISEGATEGREILLVDHEPEGRLKTSKAYCLASKLDELADAIPAQQLPPHR